MNNGPKPSSTESSPSPSMPDYDHLARIYADASSEQLCTLFNSFKDAHRFNAFYNSRQWLKVPEYGSFEEKESKTVKRIFK